MPDSVAPSSLRTLLGLLTSRDRAHLALLLALMLLGAVAELLTIGALIPFLALLADEPGASHLPLLDQLFVLVGGSRAEQLLALTLLFMGAILAAASLRLSLAWATQRFARQFGHHLATEIHRRTLHQPYDWHVRHRSSETIAAVDQVQQLLYSVILPLLQGLSAALLTAFILVALVAVEPLTTLWATAAVAALYVSVSLVARQRIRRAARVIGEAQERRVRLVQESLGGIRDIIIDGSQDDLHQAFSRVDLRLNKARARLSFVAQAPRFLIEAAGMIAIAGLALMLASRPGGLAAALPVLGALALGAQRLLPLMQQIYQSYTSLSGNTEVVARVARQLSLPMPQLAEHTSTALAFEHEVAVREVGYSYPSRSVQVLRSVDLTIAKGARVALTGRTGSGKSTLADIIMGLIPPSEGSVLIDGAPLTEENRRSWQANIAHVSQSVFLSDASIARNIALGGREPDMARVTVAARDAALDGFIQSLPDGYSTHVGERGVQLSGGQRQRLGLARAFYKRASFLVLDEATSALDPETEVAIGATLDAFAARGGTVLLIAHRSSLLSGCDAVIRLEGGQVVDVEKGCIARLALP